MELFAEEVRADVDLVNIELREGIVDEVIAIQPGAETAGNAGRVKAEFKMFFLRCWVLVSAF